MIKKLNWIMLGVLIGLCAAVFRFDIQDAVQAAASHMDRLVLGSGNYGTDPNTTADITGQYDEYWSNATDGTWDAGAANITNTGNITTTATLSAEQLTSTDDATIGDDLTITGQELKLGATVAVGGRVLMYVTAREALAANDVCVWDATTIAVEANWDGTSTTAADLDDDLGSDVGGYHVLYYTTDSGTFASDSIYVRGTELDQGASFDAGVACPDGAHPQNGMIKSTTEPYRWSQVDSIWSVGFSSMQVDITASPIMSVVKCDGANTDIAGVSIATVADEAEGWIVTHGIVLATVDAATTDATPGCLLEGASGGDFVVDAAATTGGNAARAVEFSDSDNLAIKVMVDAY